MPVPFCIQNKFYERYTRAAMVTAGVFSILAFFGQSNAVLDALASFRAIYLILFTVFGAIFCCLRLWKDAVISLVFLVLNASTFVLFFAKQPSTIVADATPIRVLELNVFGGKNHDWDKTMEEIRKQQPDLVGIAEVTGTWEKVLRQTMKEYPYQVYEPNFGGIALLSKHPLKNSKIEYCGKVHRPRIASNINIDGRTVRIIVLHPLIPIVHENNRDKELAEVGNEVKNGAGPAIIFGDFNITPWSKAFDALIEKADLNDSERGFGFQPSWCAWGLWFFPIDHCLVSKEFSVVDRKMLQYIGSDHFPIVVDLKLPKQSS
jgi:endonuclease/exonuclease/phosphatase (EEP) superfamily protein YafD